MSAIHKNEDYLVQLDGLRFLAVTLVLFDHWLADINELALGAMGVNMFFVLSGFLITRILLTSKSKTYGQPSGLKDYLKKFYIRRTLRIFPIYYLSIFALWLLNDPSVQEKLGWNLLYASNIYIAVYHSWLGVTDHFWSLAVEEQFYVFFPLLIFFIPRRFVVQFCILLITLSIGARFALEVTNADWKIAYVTMFTCLDSFGLGAIMAYLFLYHKDKFVWLFSNRYLLVVSLLVFIANTYIRKTYWPQHNMLNERFIPSVFFFFLIGGAIIGYKGWLKWLLQNPVSSYLGRISYGIYVYHNFVYNYYHKIEGSPVIKVLTKFPQIENNPALRFVFLFAITIGLATASWYIIEKPINALKDKLA
jgi:peptidoglycan/LPS O-acetylase OafA/YrhL